MAFAISVTSALVGVGFSIIDSSKCVATIEEVKSYEVDENVKINFDLSKIYLFKESGELLYSPYQQ